MSGRLQINFAPDMPAATVEVISPDLETVDRVLLRPGQSKNVDVPSEATFLRVHLASGKTITLKDPGNLNRTISASDLLSRQTPRRSRRDLERAPARPPSSLDKVYGSPLEAMKGVSPTDRLEGDIRVTLASGGQFHAGQFSSDRRAVEFSAHDSEAAFELRLASANLEAVVRLPGDLNRLTVTSDELRNGRLLLTVRIRTSSAMADMIGGYLCRGDLYSAEAMAEWADEAEGLLQQKMRDPFAAAVGAYLLLRLRRFNRLSSWCRNLADWFPNLSDGSIIYAWQSVYQRTNEAEIKKYMQKALDAPLPVFTEGLKLLRDGVRLLDKPQEALQKLNAATGVVLWSSPFTTTMHAKGDSSDAFDLDVGYAAQL